MVRLHFTLRDLGRVRVADRPYPQVEVLLALFRLQGTEAGAVFDPWRRRVRADLPPAVLRQLTDLAPADRGGAGAAPRFLVHARCPLAAEDWIDEVRAVPQRQVRQDLARVTRATSRPVAGWLRRLAEDRTARGDLGASLRAFVATALTPVTGPVAAAAADERTRLARATVDGGLDQLFGGLPGVRWQPPTLHANCPGDLDIHLAGRGLMLLPSYFGWSATPVIHDPAGDEPPVLVLPVRRRPFPAAAPAGRPLSAALGRTRAALLELVAQPATTGELARRLDLAPATVSWHLAALRAAGLVTTRRNRYALHSLTSRGESLLDQPGRPGFRPSSNLWTDTG